MDVLLLNEFKKVIRPFSVSEVYQKQCFWRGLDKNGWCHSYPKRTLLAADQKSGKYNDVCQHSQESTPKVAEDKHPIEDGKSRKPSVENILSFKTAF